MTKTQNIVSMHSSNKCKAINERQLIINKLPCVDYCAGAVQRGRGCVRWAPWSDLLFWAVFTDEERGISRYNRVLFCSVCV